MISNNFPIIINHTFISIRLKLWGKWKSLANRNMTTMKMTTKARMTMKREIRDEPTYGVKSIFLFYKIIYTIDFVINFTSI